jgi:hypothetical protein
VVAQSDVELIAGALRSLAHDRRGSSLEHRARVLADVVERCLLCIEHDGACESSSGCEPRDGGS